MTDTTRTAPEARVTTPALNQAQLDAQTKIAVAAEAEINKVITAEQSKEAAQAKADEAEATKTAPPHSGAELREQHREQEQERDREEKAKEEAAQRAKAAAQGRPERR